MALVARLYVLSMLCALLFAGPAQAAGSPQINPIVGVWTKSQGLPDGRSLSVMTRFGADGAFSGTASVDGQVVWEYGGTWSLQDRVLTYHYEHSSRPLPESAKTDVDDVISMGANSLVLRSRQSGKEHTFLRMQ